MRFKAGIHNVNTFTKFIASLASLGNVAWVRLSNDTLHFTIIPEQGTQVWAVLTIETVFESYTIQSAVENNTINLEVPLQPLLGALRSAYQATTASIRLTKKDNVPSLCMTIATSIDVRGSRSDGFTAPIRRGVNSGNGIPTEDEDEMNNLSQPTAFSAGGDHWRETVITQDIPVRVLSAESVAGLHQPVCREPDVYISLPPLSQLKAISDRFTRLALATSPASGSSSNFNASNSGLRATKAPKLELSATMHGSLRLALRTDALNIASTWTGLNNPDLDPSKLDGGEDEVRAHPSTRMREATIDYTGNTNDGWGEGWAGVRIDGKDWSRVLSVGRLAGRVVACFCHEHALILYVYLPNDENGVDDSVLTYYVSSYST